MKMKVFWIIVISVSMPFVARLIYNLKEYGFPFLRFRMARTTKTSGTVKGSLKRKKIREHLSLLDENEYKIIEKVSVKVNQETFYIDYFVIARTGIFLLKVFNYAGSVEEIGEKYWKSDSGITKHTFLSPEEELKPAIQELMKKLKIDSENLFHVIGVFPDNTRVGTRDETPAVPLFLLCERIEKEKRHYWSYEEVEQIYLTMNEK